MRKILEVIYGGMRRMWFVLVRHSMQTLSQRTNQASLYPHPVYPVQQKTSLNFSFSLLTDGVSTLHDAAEVLLTMSVRNPVLLGLSLFICKYSHYVFLHLNPSLFQT